jgi:hypothetical protein
MPESENSNPQDARARALAAMKARSAAKGGKNMTDSQRIAAKQAEDLKKTKKKKTSKDKKKDFAPGLSKMDAGFSH